LLSNLVGVMFREWRACRRLTDATITFALLVLTAAVLALTYGNYKGDQAAQAAAQAAATSPPETSK
jgi:hypothetical protein